VKGRDCLLLVKLIAYYLQSAISPSFAQSLRSSVCFRKGISCCSKNHSCAMLNRICMTISVISLFTHVLLWMIY
jgi:hypothetical protein